MDQLERVSRAICEACGENPEQRWQDYEYAATAAIAATSEPDDLDWIVRTDSSVPVAPEWARGYCIKLREDANPELEFDIVSEPLATWRWAVCGDSGDIVAIRWLP